MKGRWISVVITVALAVVALGVPLGPSVVAAPPQPTDCAAESYNLLRSKNCNFEASVPDTNWEASAAYVTIAQSTTQVHDGAYALQVSGTSSWTSGRQGGQTIKTSNPIPVTPGATYTFASWVFIPSSSTRITNASLRVGWYAASDCSGSQLSTNTADVSALDTWTYAYLTQSAPGTANCAQARLQINASTGSTAVGPVYFDNVIFYSSTPTAISLRTLTARAPLSPLAALPVAGLALAGGAAAWRRRRTQGC